MRVRSKTSFECESFGGVVLFLVELPSVVDSAIKNVCFEQRVVLLTKPHSAQGVEYQVIESDEVLLLKDDMASADMTPSGCKLFIASGTGQMSNAVVLEIFTPEEFTTHMADILCQLDRYIISREEPENIAGLIGSILPYDKIKDVKNDLLAVLNQPREESAE